MNLIKVNRKAATLREQAYEIIKKAIMSGSLKPGQPLIEEKLAKDLDLSRTPLREALVLLEHNQYIEMIPYKGTFVTELTQKEAEEIYHIRELLEPAAVCLALDYISNQEIKELQEYFCAIRKDIINGNLDVFLESNKLIHNKLLEHGKNETLRLLVLNYIDKLQRYQSIIKAWSSQDIIEEYTEHCEIIEVLITRDSQKINKKMVTHLRNCCHRIITQLNKQDI